MEISAQIISYTLSLQNDTVFVLQIETKFSKSIINKTIDDFLTLHKELCYFSHYKIQNGKLLDIIPKFPIFPKDLKFISNERSIFQLQKLNEYLQEILDVANSPYFNKFNP